MARPVAACGTISGYRRHTRLQEPPCGPCTEANRTYARDYRKTCTHESGCDKVIHARGLCHRHDRAVNGDTPPSGHARLPFQPLADHLQRRHANDSHVGRYYGRHGNHIYAEACGVHPRVFQEWKVNGLTIRAADRAAVHLGTLPIFIWGDQFYADIFETLEQAA
jgi:hypothetical protein